MIEKQMNRKIHIQSFISLIFVFMFLFLNVFYLIKIEAVNTPLSNDLSQKNLGEIISQGSTVTQEEIISKIKEKNQSLVSKDLKVSEITTTKAKVKSDDFTGEVDVIFTVKQKESPKVELSTVVRTKNLGEIISQGSTVTQEEIISKIKEKNQSLVSKDLKVSEITTTKAKVKSDDFTGEVDVIFTVKQKESPKVELSTVVRIKNLGEIISQGSTVTNDEIIKQVKDKNTDLKEKDVQVASITENKKAKVKSNDYKSEVDVIFTVKQKESPKVELSTVVKTTNLDTIETKDTKVTNDEIIKQVKDKNIDLKEKDVQVVSITENKTAKIKSTDFTGEVEVEFAVKKKSFFSLFMIAIILSIGVAAFALLGYYFYEKNNKKID
ncbi:hypothetical protein CWO85_02145 [Candidatus Phytoplasma ziziphi]|uniref:Variable membrane protein A n=1 Tax=Ziziphus jujuba witches'-broom phytoplasma TaxID=135727 RepID=A0A660HMN3_ZIZJU|nr:hypothetical protein [Candidatus Phytoplasma ziziphi]AYJ01311.1 hypothetical protein CWO85_02145 [Candidatus Phytoplasma ziziphi]